MDIREYFENLKGRGILATADDQGKVDAAIYATPHIIDKGTIAFIMPDRLTHHNLQTNNHAAYLFMEDGPGYKGVRLYLTKTREENDPDLIAALSRRKYPTDQDAGESSFLVSFKLVKTRPLIGG